MEMQYEVRYLLNGEEHTVVVEASSAAAASESVRHQVSGEGNEVEDFELIQVQLLEESTEEAPSA